MVEEYSEKPPRHDGQLPLRGRGDILVATTGHVAVHLGAGAGSKVAVPGDLFRGEEEIRLLSRPRAGRW
jgi:hypothetical protein